MGSVPDRPIEREHGELFRLLVENVTDYAIFVIDPEGRVESWNPGAERLLGYREDEILGQSVAVFFTPEDIEQGFPQRELHQALEQGRGNDDRWHVRKDGTRFWCGGTMTPLWDEDHKLRGFAKIMRDRTEWKRSDEALREAEHRFRTLTQSVPVGIFQTDSEGNCLFVNQKWCELAGMSPEAAQGHGWSAALHPADRDRIGQEWYAAARERREFRADYRFRTPQGETRWLHGAAVALCSNDGEITGYFGTVTDITDRKRAEDELREADRRKDEFLATLAHELRNPLAPVRNSLEILKMPNVDGATTQLSRDMIERQVHHLVRLVDDLLDVSRVMRGKIQLRREPVEIAAMMARAVEMVQPLIESRRHILELSAPDESLLLDGDPVRLAQIVANLLANAAKYTEPTGHIWLSVECSGDRAVLRVRDNGIGISPEMLPRVFDLFVQADHPPTKSQGGLGVGLTLVKNLVALHGGTVEAHSPGLGKGCEFVVRLPLMDGKQPKAKADGEPPQEAVRPSGLRLLVVDDNQDAANSLAMLLRLKGHGVRIANNGPTALEIASDYTPDVVFLDIGMPEMDGYEVARRMRRLPGLENVVLAAVTGWGQFEDRLRTSRAGFDHHLVKPPEPNEIDGVLVGIPRKQ